MAAGSAKEVREGMTGVKRAAEWDPAQRYGKNARQVFCWVLQCVSCSVSFSSSLWIFIHATAREDLGVISSSMVIFQSTFLLCSFMLHRRLALLSIYSLGNENTGSAKGAR